MASQGFSKSGRNNSVKGFTYEISQEQGIFSFAVDCSENTNLRFRKYSTPAAFDAKWYKIEWHDCDHDEPDEERTGCGSWKTVRSKGNVPEGI